MFDDIKEIINMVVEQEETQALLRKRFETDFDYAVLVPYQAVDTAGNVKKGYNAYTSSAPKNFLDKVSDGLNRSDLSISIKLDEEAQEEERQAANIGELFLYAALNDIDRNLRMRGEPPLREWLSWLINCRGWYGLKCLVYNRARGEPTFFDVVPWDPMHMTFQYGSNGLLWAAYKRKASAAKLKAEYGVELQERDADYIDFFDADSNAVVLLEGERWLKKPEKHKINGVPVLVGAVGTMPTVQGRVRTDREMVQYRGDSVYSASRGLFDPFNKQVSMLMDMAERSVAGSIIHKSATGQKKIGGDPFRTFQEIGIGPDEEITPLELPKAPPETAAILGILDTDKQQSMLPYPLAYGGTNQPLSGKALDRLADAQRAVYSPRTSAMGQCYSWLSEQLIAQFAAKGRPQTMKGFEKNGKFFQMEIKPKQINKGWFINVQVVPKIARDLESDIQTAVMSVSPIGPAGDRLLSFQSAREDIMQIRNPDAEKDKILLEKGESLPPIIAMQIAAQFEKIGRHDIALQIQALLNPAGAGAGPAPTPGGAGSPRGAPPPVMEGRAQGGPPGAAPPRMPPAGGGGGGMRGMGQQGVPPEVAEQIAQIFVQAGQPDLGRTVLTALGVPL